MKPRVTLPTLVILTSWLRNLHLCKREFSLFKKKKRAKDNQAVSDRGSLAGRRSQVLSCSPQPSLGPPHRSPLASPWPDLVDGLADMLWNANGKEFYYLPLLVHVPEQTRKSARVCWVRFGLFLLQLSCKQARLGIYKPMCPVFPCRLLYTWRKHCAAPGQFCFFFKFLHLAPVLPT